MLLSPASRARPRQFTPTRRQQGLVQFGSAIDPTMLVNYIGGLVMSNDATTPNSVLDVAAGCCVDSTNSALMRVPAVTKSTGSVWSPGTGKGGMGKGLTVAASTWYHVFVFSSPAGPDVYFDTSVTAANIPAPGPSRRVGSIKTDGSSNILAFYMEAGSGWVYWAAPPLDQNAQTIGTAGTNITISVPPGVRTQARCLGGNTANATFRIMVYSPDIPDSAAGATYGNMGMNPASGFPLQFDVWSNTTQQVRIIAESAAQTYSLRTIAYQDLRGV